jgi:dipeptide/tripeptide permease
MTIAHISAWLMVAAGGLFSGGILFVAVERVNQWQRMPVDQYVIDFRRALYRLDPLLPILGALTALAAVVFALNSDERAAVLAWIGTAMIVAIIIASVSIAEPMNSKFRRLSEGKAPDGVERIRVSWGRFHLARTVVALGSFACLAAAVV